MSLVSAEFVVPPPLRTERFDLALLGPEHNASDHAAWTSSIDFIRSLPGWDTSIWPRPMALEENLLDCTSHLHRSGSRRDFAYTVLLPDSHDVVGCVYFKPTDPPRDGAVAVLSWVTAEHADLDQPLHGAVTRWLSDSWPWSAVEYDAR